MRDDDIAYFTRRARQEYAAARNATHASAAMSHLILADLYTDELYLHAAATFDHPSASVDQGVSA